MPLTLLGFAFQSLPLTSSIATLSIAMTLMTFELSSGFQPTAESVHIQPWFYPHLAVDALIGFLPFKEFHRLLSTSEKVSSHVLFNYCCQ